MHFFFIRCSSFLVAEGIYLFCKFVIYCNFNSDCILSFKDHQFVFCVLSKSDQYWYLTSRDLCWCYCPCFQDWATCFEFSTGNDVAVKDACNVRTSVRTVSWTVRNLSCLNGRYLIIWDLASIGRCDWHRWVRFLLEALMKMDLLFWGWTFYWQAAALYKRAYPHDRMMDNVTAAMMYVQRRWVAQLLFSPTELLRSVMPLLNLQDD